MSNKKITSEILVAYSQCHRKAFLLLFSDIYYEPHDYSQILEDRKNAHRNKYLEIFKQTHEDAKPYSDKNVRNNEFLLEATLKTECWEAECDVLTKIDQDRSSDKLIYEPTITVGTYSITKEQRLELFFIGEVLGRIQSQLPVQGTIVGLDGKVHQVKLKNGYKVISPFLKILQIWIAEKPAEPPTLILNKHCPSCQFRDVCREQAVKENNLSLLDRITPKALQKYNKKGIFTIHQLSYLYKARRDRMHKNSALIKHNLELQALAIREKKIYVKELPDLQRVKIEIFLDIEGIPDQKFYYLFGILICNEDQIKYHSFWVDGVENEKEIWIQLIKKLNQYHEAPIYHYGSYELKAISELTKKYDYEFDLDNIKNRLININKYIFGKLYFPVFSNSLKEVGKFLGYTWTSSNASGLKSLVWRYNWEICKEIHYKQALLTYNQEDCDALHLLLNELCRIKNIANSESDIDFAENPKKHITETGEQIHNQFEKILKIDRVSGKKKISLKIENQTKEKRKVGAQIGHQGYKRIIPKSEKVSYVSLEKICPRCGEETLNATKNIVEKVIIDLIFLKNACKKVNVRYRSFQGSCSNCNYKYNPLTINRSRYKSNQIIAFESGQIYGHGFRAWFVYQRLVLRLPYDLIIQQSEDMFNEKVSRHAVLDSIKYFARYYSETENKLTQNILKSRFIHIDETDINIENKKWYVWIFTDGKHVIFNLTETREAQFVHEFLSEYSGIVISDFYAGYDSLKCKQQKCWVHLIRDLNNDLWRNPFDQEFESFVVDIRDLIIPILEIVQEKGSKKSYLNKFRKNIDRFYKDKILEAEYFSEITIKYQKRFERYKDKLFTFMDEDALPWNNNTAERGIIHLSTQRKISKIFTKNITLSYLIMLGISQTCKFYEKPVLKFLLSGETNIEEFKSPKSRNTTVSVISSK